VRENVNINAGSQRLFLMCKAVTFLITVMLALASPGWSACDLQGALAERDIITLEINAPSKSLVEISANDIRVIVEDPNELTPSGQYGSLIEVYGLSSEGRPILKKIITAPVGDDMKALQSALSNSAASIVLTQKNGYFFAWRDQLIAGNSIYACMVQSHIFHHESGQDFAIHAAEWAEPEIIAKHKILEQLLRDEGSLNSLRSQVVSRINLAQAKDVPAVLDSLISEPRLLRSFWVQHVNRRLSLSQLEIPYAPFKLAQRYQDGNALAYLSDISRLNTFEIYPLPQTYFWGLSAHGETRRAVLGITNDFERYLSTRLAINFQKNGLDLDQASLTGRMFVEKNILAVSKLGRIDSFSDGFQLSAYQLMPAAETFWAAHLYAASPKRCARCRNTGLTFEQAAFSRIWDMSVSKALRFEEPEHILHPLLLISARKRLSQKLSLEAFSGLRLKPDAKASFGFTLKLLDTKPKNSARSMHTESFIEIFSNSAIMPLNEEDRSAYFENTPNFLKRTWADYMRFKPPVTFR
jgi:hypothetical protein